jgi:hypothetical protein
VAYVFTGVMAVEVVVLNALITVGTHILPDVDCCYVAGYDHSKFGEM